MALYYFRNIYIVLLIIILFIINNQPCYSINISPKGTNTQVRNNLRKKMTVISQSTAKTSKVNKGKDAFMNAFAAAAAKLGATKKPAAKQNGGKPKAKVVGIQQFKIPQQIPHPPSAMVPETKHATSTADSLLAAFAPITKKLTIDHCLPKSSDHLIKSFDAHITPNPIKKGSPLKIYAGAEFEKKFTQGIYNLQIMAFGFPVFNQTDDICKDSTGFIPTLGPVAISGYKCPVELHHKAEVTTTITVPPALVDGVNIKVKIFVQNQDGEPVMCEDTSFET